jgi:hypothetical protein
MTPTMIQFYEVLVPSFAEKSSTYIRCSVLNTALTDYYKALVEVLWHSFNAQQQTTLMSTILTPNVPLFQVQFFVDLVDVGILREKVGMMIKSPNDPFSMGLDQVTEVFREAGSSAIASENANINSTFPPLYGNLPSQPFLDFLENARPQFEVELIQELSQEEVSYCCSYSEICNIL